MQKTTKRVSVRSQESVEDLRDREIAERISVEPRPEFNDWFVHVADERGIVTTTRHTSEDSAHGHALESYLDARDAAILADAGCVAHG